MMVAISLELHVSRRIQQLPLPRLIVQQVKVLLGYNTRA
jgi:hypothetical protein